MVRYVRELVLGCWCNGGKLGCVNLGLCSQQVGPDCYEERVHDYEGQ